MFVTLPSPHPKAPTRPSTPEVLQAKERALTLYLSAIITFGFAVESIKEIRGVSRTMPQLKVQLQSLL